MARKIDADGLEKWMKRDDWGTPDERWRPESEFGAILDAQPTLQDDEEKWLDVFTEAYRKGWNEGREDGKRDAMKWISVKERLPQDEQWVAALLYGLVGYNTILLQYNAMLNEFITDDGIEYDIDDVAYWVGLPEPPEVADE